VPPGFAFRKIERTNRGRPLDDPDSVTTEAHPPDRPIGVHARPPEPEVMVLLGA
jgi:hypothetical protein